VGLHLELLFFFFYAEKLNPLACWLFLVKIINVIKLQSGVKELCVCQVSLLGLDVVSCLIDRMCGGFKPHVTTGIGMHLNFCSFGCVELSSNVCF
jgi:hypothetical protein